MELRNAARVATGLQWLMTAAAAAGPFACVETECVGRAYAVKFWADAWAVQAHCMVALHDSTCAGSRGMSHESSVWRTSGGSQSMGALQQRTQPSARARRLSPRGVMDRRGSPGRCGRRPDKGRNSKGARQRHSARGRGRAGGGRRDRPQRARGAALAVPPAVCDGHLLPPVEPRRTGRRRRGALSAPAGRTAGRGKRSPPGNVSFFCLFRLHDVYLMHT